jgi:hypothetical protein
MRIPRRFKNMISTKKDTPFWDSKRNIIMLLKNHFQGSSGIEITISGRLVICPGFIASFILPIWVLFCCLFFLPFPGIFSLLQTDDYVLFRDSETCILKKEYGS